MNKKYPTPSDEELKNSLKLAIEMGHMEEVKPGEYRLTELGQEAARKAIETPAGKEFFEALDQGHKRAKFRKTMRKFNKNTRAD